MSREALRTDLDLKIQRMKEYACITHGYANENVQYPVHVRRSHDGEKPHRSLPIGSRHRPKTSIPILTPSFNDNRMHHSHHRPCNPSRPAMNSNVFVVPPNKTIEDTRVPVDHSKSLRKSSSSSTHSSPVLSSHRPHSIAALLSASADETQVNSLFDSSSTNSTKTSKRRFLWRFFHYHQWKSS